MLPIERIRIACSVDLLWIINYSQKKGCAYDATAGEDSICRPAGPVPKISAGDRLCHSIRSRQFPGIFLG